MTSGNAMSFMFLPCCSSWFSILFVFLLIKKKRIFNFAFFLLLGISTKVRVQHHTFALFFFGLKNML